MRKKLACLIYGRDFHYLDHLAPLASLLKIPLITSDVEIEEKGVEQYPDVSISWFDHFSMANEIAKYDGIISCFSKKHFEANFLNPKPSYIWCPHGNSDKDNLQALEHEDHILIYGKQMEERLKEKRISRPHICIGNYRYSYFLKHKTFYEKFLRKTLHLCEQKTFLFAPTWKDYEQNDPFEIAENFIKNTPQNMNLIVKFHPNTFEKDYLSILKLEQKYSSKNIHFINGFFPIFPLLDRIDGYIGDMSSIGYDFLLFDKPFAYLSKKKNLPLYACGPSILDKKNVWNIFEGLLRKNPYRKERKRLREYTFSNNISLADIESFL